MDVSSAAGNSSTVTSREGPDVSYFAGLGRFPKILEQYWLMRSVSHAHADH
jgi:hypothetical protein